MKNRSGYILIALPILYFLYVTIRYAQNIPYNDDFPTILGFLSDLKKTTTAQEALKLYFAPYGEHRVFFIHFFSWLQLQLCGHLNFAVLPLIGNIGFIIAYIFLIKSVRINNDRKLLLLAPTAFIIFQLQSWSNNIWSMASLSNTLIFCWIILALYYLFKAGDSNRYFLLGILFALFATYTNGNGVFVPLSAALVLLFQKKYGKGLICLGLFLSLFLLNVVLHGSSGSIIERMAHQGPVKIAGMFLVFLGSNFFHPSFLFVALGVGSAFVLFFAYLFFAKKYYLVNPVICALFLFIFITAVGVATQRDLLDIYTSAPSRYRVYCSLLIAMSYIALLEVFPKLRYFRATRYIAIPASVLFFIGSNFVAQGKIENRYALNRSHLFLLNNNIPSDRSLDSTYKFSLQAGFIRPQDMPISGLLVPNTNKDNSIDALDKNTIYRIDTIGEKDSYVFVKGWAGKNDNSNMLNNVQAIVYLKGDTKIYRAGFLEVPEFINDRNMQHFAICGFLAVIPSEEYHAADSVALGISRDILGKHIVPFYLINNKVAPSVK